MVAEMEAEALEQAHKLDEMLKARDKHVDKRPGTREADPEQVEISSIIGSQDTEEENVGPFSKFHCLIVVN